MQKAEKAAPKAARGKAGSGAGKRGRRSSKQTEALQDKIQAALKRSKKGLALSALAKAVGVKDHIISYQLRRMRDGKRVRIVGDRRNARWLAR